MRRLFNFLDEHCAHGGTQFLRCIAACHAASCMPAPPPVVLPLPLVVHPDWLLRHRLRLSSRHWAGDDTNSLDSFVQLG
jgi:hypothetical protein